MNTLGNNLAGLHDRTFALVSHLQTPFLLLVRLYWGWQLAQSGWGKLHHLDNVAEFFGTLNLPHPAQMALAISCLEFFGGILFAIGLFSGLISRVLTFTLLMPSVPATPEPLFSFSSNPVRFSVAPPLSFLVQSLFIPSLVPGKL